MKSNPLLTKIEARHRAELKCRQMFTLQQCEDILFIALDEVDYPDKEDFVRTFWGVFLKWAEISHEDFKADKKLVYTREDVDRRLRQIRGEHYMERSERYFMVREKE